LNEQQVRARSAIEALRSGVPSRHCISQLGTTQDEIKSAFEAQVLAAAQGAAVEPLIIEAGFGEGKSHLLNYFAGNAESRGFVTSMVVISPEMPLGNRHVVLKAVAETAIAPGLLGRALRALAHNLKTNSPQYAAIRLWARSAGLDERFPAMLQLYEESGTDEEFRTEILGDFEGTPLPIGRVRQKLTETGQSAAYAIKYRRAADLAHDRIRVLARFYRACGAVGWAIMFDELERITYFSVKQRIAVYEELGWWAAVAREEGAGIVPVFASVPEALKHMVEQDAPQFRASSLIRDASDPDILPLAGIELIRRGLRLIPPNHEQKAQIQYRVKDIYKTAYELDPPDTDVAENGHSSVRYAIRSWITQWDLHRYDSAYKSNVVMEDVGHEDKPIEDTDLPSDDDANDAE